MSRLRRSTFTALANSTIALPAAVKETSIDAQFKDGVLRISLPKAEQSLPKKIEVKS